MNDLRINVVRSHKMTHEDHGGYFSPFIWEAAARGGDDSIKKLIDTQIQASSASVVLIGTNTYDQRWVKYEIFRSMRKGNKLLGIHINGIEGRDGRGKPLGPNPFSYLGLPIVQTVPSSSPRNIVTRSGHRSLIFLHTR